MSEQQPEAWIIVNKETGYRTQVSDLAPFLYHKEIFEVIPLYTAPPKPEHTEQEPVVKITSIHADGENLPVVITGVVLSDAVNIWDLPIKNNNLLFLAPPKREPLGLEIMDACGSEDYREGFKDGALYAEKCHGIGGEE